MHAFLMVRDDDVTGVSGTGVVAEGVVFSDGRTAIRWMVEGMPRSTVIWDTVDEAVAVHGHDGRTHLSFAADIPWPPADLYEHKHKWKSLVLGTQGPFFCTDCGVYSKTEDGDE